MRSASGGPRVLLRRLRETMAEQVSAQERLDKIVVLIAANMVALTALKEGPSSPIRTLLLDAAERNPNDRVSLADRAAAIIADPPR